MSFCTNEPENVSRSPVPSHKRTQAVDPPPSRRMTEAPRLPQTPPVISRLDRGTHYITPTLARTNPSGPDFPLVMAGQRAGHPVRQRSRAMIDDTNEPEVGPVTD